MKWSFSRKVSVLIIAALVGPFTATGFAEQASAADNTKANQQESTTADQQSNSSSDVELARNVRRAIQSDKSLSTYAHNVKVISQNGQVTLKGSVRSQDEKDAVVAKAAEVAGKNNVVNELTVVPQNQ
jgi:osmotically-inducible protein OsmY